MSSCFSGHPGGIWGGSDFCWNAQVASGHGWGKPVSTLVGLASSKSAMLRALGIPVPLLFPAQAATATVPEWAARVARGDLEALSEVYSAHHEAVRAFARRLLGDRTVAEDLVQEVFLALPAACARFRGEAAPRTFLISIAVNHARHHARAASRRRAASERMALEPSADAGQDPEKELRRRQLAAALTRALDTLPMEQRAVFVLADVEERETAEVARIVDAPEATVRTRLFRARQALRVQLQKAGLA